MDKDLLLDAGKDLLRLALLENGRLAELLVEAKGPETGVAVKPSGEGKPGSIFRGKVIRVVQGMQAAFVDIGLPKNAFLHVKDIMPVELDNASGDDEGDDRTEVREKTPDIEELLSQGQELTVQIIKELSGNKGPRITTRVSLTGKYMVLIPGSSGIGISKKITDAKERKRLKNLIKSLDPGQSGVIVRTAAQDLTEGQIEADFQTLMKRKTDLEESEKRGAVPRCLYREQDILYEAVREYLTPEINRFLINDVQVYEALRAIVAETAPHLLSKVQLYSKSYELFSFYSVEGDIEEALSRKVRLKSGAYLIFDRTEALTVVDVNSGKYTGRYDKEETALKINLEAAAELARQLRLRNVGGIVIADFIDMESPENKALVLQKLRDEVKADKVQTVIVGITSLGLVEMTRKKVRLPLYDAMRQLLGRNPLYTANQG